MRPALTLLNTVYIALFSLFLAFPFVSSAVAASCPGCGVIDSISAYEVKGKASGGGAVAGGIVGGVVGSQFGHGSGRTVATVAGVAGGAYAGNAIEKNAKRHTMYKIIVRMDDGSSRTVKLGSADAYRTGDRVKITNGKLQRL